MLTSPILSAALSIKDEIIADKRRLHSYPELGMKERLTTEFVLHRLGELGIPTQPLDLEVGAVGLIRGNGNGPERDNCPSSRHGRPSHSGDRRRAGQVDYQRRHARLRPRLPYCDAARRGEAPDGPEGPVFRHSEAAVPARRGNPSGLQVPYSTTGLWRTLTWTRSSGFTARRTSTPARWRSSRARRWRRLTRSS